MKQNKIGRYFKYAIGEIILVVIGILIALQINNWNQNRQNRSKEVRYLKSLSADLKDQVYRMNYQIERETTNNKNLTELLNLFTTEDFKVTEDSTVLKFNAISGRTTFVIIDPTYNELLSSGEIGIIRNDSLRSTIVRFYEDLERRERILQKNNDVKDLVINPIYLKYLDHSFNMQDSDIKPIIDEKSVFKVPRNLIQAKKT